MQTMTAAQADRIRTRTAEAVARIRAEADKLERAGAPDDVVAEGFGIKVTRAQAVADARRNADARERAGMRAHAGARVGRA